jgi:hypothetical protein
MALASRINRSRLSELPLWKLKAADRIPLLQANFVLVRPLEYSNPSHSVQFFF